jgi:formamidopyrimidine-DNA glycosylase
MPELPEVETVAQGIQKRALGRRITEVEVRHSGVIAGDPEQFARGVEGRVIQKVSRKGKALVLDLAADDREPPRYLLVRLGMTGVFMVTPRDTEWGPHTHVRLALDDGAEEIRYRDVRRFGRLRSCTREELDAVLGGLGPDAQRMTESHFLAAMRGRKGAIKSWLMNQQMFAGLGNIYADEALYAAQIHPLAQPGRVPEDAAHRLYKAIGKVLKHAVQLRGTSFSDYLDAEGRPGGFLNRLRVYQKTGEPCERCRTPIRRLVIGGRSSHFCPQCQPRPRRPARMRGPKGKP